MNRMPVHICISDINFALRKREHKKGSFLFKVAEVLSTREKKIEDSNNKEHFSLFLLCFSKKIISKCSTGLCAKMDFHLLPRLTQFKSFKSPHAWR